jgi:hypothetical protein
LELKVFINNKEITIFRGATAGEAVLAYSRFSFKKLKTGYLSVYDRFGFKTEPDGPVIEGQRLYLRVTPVFQDNQ